MKKFNFIEAFNGAQVVTRCGLDVSIMQFEMNNKKYPIVARICETNQVELYTIDGFINDSNHTDDFDLMLK